MSIFRVGGNSVVRIDASAGGTLTAITTYVKEIDGLGREFDALDSTALSDTAERVIPGIEKSQEFSIRGAFDDTATTGPDAIFSTAVGTLLSFEWNPAGTVAGRRKFNMEVLVTSYKVSAPLRGEVSFEVSLKQDGSATVGTN